MTDIGDCAFLDCMGVTGIVIPDSVKHIGSRAFNAFRSLTDVYYTGTEEQWTEINSYQFIFKSTKKSRARMVEILYSLHSCSVFRYYRVVLV